MWNIERTSELGCLDSGQDLYHVIHSETKERHTFTTYKSAYFIQQLFNGQERWYNWERHGYTTNTLDASLLVSNSSYTLVRNPPEANWRFDFGDDSNTWFTMYLKKGPGWIRRKLFWWILGVKWTKI